MIRSTAVVCGLRAGRCRASNAEAGFSLIELLIVLALAAGLLAVSLGWFRNAAATVQGDASMYIVQWQLKQAREMAINQRRAVEVQFTMPNFITVVRRNLPTGTAVVSTAVLEHNTEFHRYAGMSDTPDGFGGATPIAFGGAAVIMFTADGMLTDGNGNPVNGTIFLGQPTQPHSARAITVFGPTARIRTYRWNGTAWRR